MGTVRKLSELKPGDEGKVSAYTGDSKEQTRLMEMGLLPGTAIRFIRKAPLGDPLEVEVRGYNLSLRASEAARIEVAV